MPIGSSRTASASSSIISVPSNSQSVKRSPVENLAGHEGQHHSLDNQAVFEIPRILAAIANA